MLIEIGHLELGDTPRFVASKVFCPTGQGGGVDPTCSLKKNVGITDPLAISPMDVGHLTLDQAASVQKQLHEKYQSDSDFRDAVHLLKEQTVTDLRANVVQSIVAAVANGKDPNKDKKVLKAVDADESFSRERIDEYAKSAKGYIATMDKAPPVAYPIFRGQSRKKYEAGQDVELDGPTSASQSRDVAAHYSGGQLLVIGKGAKALPVNLAVGAMHGPEGGVYAHHKAREGKESQPEYFTASLDTDEEVMVTGKFRVGMIKQETRSFEDQMTGKRKTREFEVVYMTPVKA